MNLSPRKLSAAHALLVDMLAAGRGRTSGGPSSTPGWGSREGTAER
jgi:hypothetical protein